MGLSGCKMLVNVNAVAQISHLSISRTVGVKGLHFHSTWKYKLHIEKNKMLSHSLQEGGAALSDSDSS